MSRSASDQSSNGGAAARSPADSDIRGGGEVRVEAVALGYGGAVALDGVDLSVRDGELLALLGPSGSGKTTLLRVIAGLETPDAGRVLFGGEDVTGKAVQERGIGFVFQHYALFRHLCVQDNVAYGLRARRRLRPSEAVIRARVSELLELVQLSGYGARFPNQLSGGQRQRVALARALATEPKVLLLDEPFGALDAQVRKDLRRWLRQIHHETGRTTIFVTHDQEEALELADRVAILNAGRIEQVGSPEAIHDAPASAFVAGFVGDRVGIPVTVAGGRVRLGAHALPVPADGPDGAAVLFVHPDALTLTEADGLPALVTDVRRVGAKRTASVRLAEAPVTLEVPLSAAVPELGATVGVAVARGHLFRSA